MKNEPWIDKIFKEHLLQKVSSLNTDHWIQAEAMIVAQEKKKDQRRRLFWILIIGTSVVGMMAYMLLAHPSESSSLPLPAPQVIEIKEPIAQNDIAPFDKTGLSVVNESPTQEVNTNLKTGLQISEGSENLLSSTGSSKRAKYKTPFINPAITISSDPAADKVGAVDQTIQSPSMYNHLLTEGDLANTSSNVYNRAITDIRLLHSSWKELDHERIIQGSTLLHEPIQITKQTWKESGLRMSLASQATVNVNNAAIGQLGIEWFKLKSISGKLFYGIGLGYSSSFNTNQYAQVITTYQFQSFSSSVENYGIKPQWLQWLHGQINIGVQNDRHRLVAGLKPQFLLGARGNVDQIQFNDNPPLKDLTSAKVSNLNTGWLQNDLLNTLSLTTVIAYDYKIVKQIGIGLQAEHTVRSAFKPLDYNIHQASLASWNIGFRFSYILN